jgi:chromate reductase, NAD(P)H dehydrogenase (quinone)
MSDTIRLLAFAGSVRRESFNRRLLAIAVDGARRAGAEVTLLELRDYPMPLYDQDLELEQGIPVMAEAFRQQLMLHSGLLIACPEYNSSITPLLKNTIDWSTRIAPGKGSLEAFTGKVATLVSASPGSYGGLRGLVTVRSILGNIGVIVLPGQLAVGIAHEAFDADGRLKDARQHERAMALGAELASATRSLASPS